MELCPGPNGALSPASPPGFVTALTTARSRDVPAECFDERLPRRLPQSRVLALVTVLYPASFDDPIEPTGRNLRTDFFPWPPPHPLRNDADNCTCFAAKKKLPTLKFYMKFRFTMPSAASKAMMTG